MWEKEGLEWLWSSHRAPASLLAVTVALSSPWPGLKNHPTIHLLTCRYGHLWHPICFWNDNMLSLLVAIITQSASKQASWRPREQWRWAHQDRFWKISSRYELFGGLIRGSFDHHIERQRAWPSKEWWLDLNILFINSWIRLLCLKPKGHEFES